MGRPRGTIDPAVTSGRLVDAATRRFSEQGYARTSLAQVAADAGMTAPSLLYHFASKEELFNAVLRATWQRVHADLAPILEADLDATTLLAQALQTLLGREQRQAALFRQLHAALLSGDGVGAAAVNDTLLPLIDDIEAAVRRASPATPADAPVREALLYVVLAHTAKHPLGQLAPQEMQRIEAHEVQLVVALLRSALGEPGG
jgi:AcrR family transcriptional regulator